jgi:HTH-type transcriptional regulator / antitoxin HigA
MTDHVQFQPNWASPPGDTIADIMEDRGWKIPDFAERIGFTVESANDLLLGRVTITVRVARTLEKVVGGSAEFWVARDSQFREDATRLSAADEEWLGALPLGDMIRYGWLQPAPRPSEEAEAGLHLFGLPSVAAWRQTYGSLQAAAAYRTSPSFDSKPGSLAAWLRQGEIVADQTSCSPWNAETFKAALFEARRLTLEKNPDRFVPALRELCSGCGVAVAIVRAPQGCRASGATKFLTPEKALLLLSFRYLSDDQFWFTFFHEAGHLLLHGQGMTFLEGLDVESDKQEQEANDFAERVLIPENARSSFLTVSPEVRSIARFAKAIGIAPGIVVGQLQHYGRIRRNHFNGMKRRFRWE